MNSEVDLAGGPSVQLARNFRCTFVITGVGFEGVQTNGPHMSIQVYAGNTDRLELLRLVLIGRTDVSKWLSVADVG